MIRTKLIEVLCGLLVAGAIPLNAQSRQRQAIWEPPGFELPSQFPKPTKPKPIITSLKVSGISIRLEHTHLDTVGRSLQAPVGSRGDASEALGWVCLYGRDDKGLWGLWLMSGEIDGPAIGSFQWQRFPSDAMFDHRCKFVPDSAHAIDLPVHIRLGMTASQVESAIGTPTSKFQNIQVFSHEHSLTSKGEPYSADNGVFIRYDNDTVSAMLVNYTISS